MLQPSHARNHHHPQGGLNIAAASNCASSNSSTTTTTLRFNRRNSLNSNNKATPSTSSRKASDDITDFKERLRKYQGIVLDDEPTSSKALVGQSSSKSSMEPSKPTTKEELIKEAQQLLTEDSIIISPSKSFLHNSSKIFDDSMLLEDTEITEKPSETIESRPTIDDHNITATRDEKLATPKSLNQTNHNMTPSKLVSPRVVDTIMAQPERNPLELEREKLVNERLEDVQAQIAKLEKAISILDHKEMEVKNEKREQCDAFKNVIKEASSKLDAIYAKIDSLQKKQDHDLKFLAKEQKQLKEVLHQIDTKRFQLMKELEGLTKSHPKESLSKDNDHVLANKQQNLKEIEQQLNTLLQEQEVLYKELEDMETDEELWLRQISENATILVGSNLTEEQQKNLLTLVKREKEIRLRVERLKEKYSPEIFLIDLKYEFNKSVHSLTKTKEEAEQRRVEVCKRIETKRIELEKLEIENINLKKEYGENKEKLISISKTEGEKIKILEQFTSSLTKEVYESTAILERAKSLHEEEIDLKAFSSVVNLFNTEFLSLLSQEQNEDTNKIAREMKTLFQNALLPNDETNNASKRAEFISSLEQKINLSKQKLSSAEMEISNAQLNIQKSEQDLADLKKKEFERLNHFSNLVSELEQEIGALVNERKECDDEIDRCISELQEIEESYSKIKESAEKQIAEKLQGCTEEELKQTEECFARCEMFVNSLNQIKDVITKISRKCNCDCVNNFIEACNNVESQLSQIVQKKMEKSNKLRDCIEQIDSLTNNKKLCQEQLDKLIANQRKQQDEKAKQLVQKEFRKAELDRMIAALDEQRKNKIAESDSLCEPVDSSITKLEQEIHELTVTAQTQKKTLNAMKRDLEEAEAVFTGKVSQIRAQRQHLKHRLDLKLQAVENVKNSGAEIIMRSIKPPKSKENKLNHSTTSSYYNMYMKKKDPNVFNDTPIEDEIFRSLEEESKEQVTRSNEIVVYEVQHDVSKDVDQTYCEEDPVKEDRISSGVTNSSSMTLSSHHDEMNASQSQPRTTPSKSTLPQHANSLPKTTVAKQQNLFMPNRASFKLFGPNSKALGREDIQYILEKFQFMCNGCLVHKKKSTNEYVLRHVCLSQEFTRLLIRDNKKKVPESFIKVEHIESVAGNKDQHVKNLDGAFTFVMKTDTKKHEFLTFDEGDYNNWMEGLNLLIDNKQNLFSLRYNIRDLFNNN
nr:unnamed protein product [Naegleria fowleri]